MSKCGDCKFYQVNAQAVNQGACLRYPPQTSMVPKQTQLGMQVSQVSFFPFVQAAQWCGEWQRNLLGEDS